MRLLLMLEVVMSIVRWIAYCLLGYLAYQLCEGALSRRKRTSSPDLARALNEGHGRSRTLTGPGVGRDEYVADNDGSAMRQRVGRGVVSR